MLHSMPSTNMFLPRRASVISARHSRSSGTSMTRKPLSTSDLTVATYDATICGSLCSRHMLSSRIVAPALQFAGAHAAQQHLLVERDDEVRLVAAVGDPLLRRSGSGCR